MTTLATTLTPVRADRAPGFWRLAIVHAKGQFLESVRLPVALFSTIFFPAMSMLFFIVPQREVADNPLWATAATGQLLLFSTMSTALFTFGSGIADDRAQPWDAYQRSLPVGPGPRMAGRVLGALPFSLFGLVPLVAIAWLLTSATVTWTGAVAGAGALVLATLPFGAMAFAVGFLCGPKSALAVVQLLLFPLAFAGGLLIPPEQFPAWLDALSQWLPSRAGRDLIVAAITPADASARSVVVVAAWTAAALALALWAYRRDARRRS